MRTLRAASVILVLAIVLSGTSCTERQRSSFAGTWVSKEGLTICLDFRDDEKVELSITRNGVSYYAYDCRYKVDKSRIVLDIVRPGGGYSPSAPAVFGMTRQLMGRDVLEFNYELSEDEQTLDLLCRLRFTKHHFTRDREGVCPTIPE